MSDDRIELADSAHCTACQACIQACPQKCISLVEDEFDCVHAVIDECECIKCGKCKKVCHLENDFFHGKSDEVYVAWSNDEYTRNSSASGGIASEIYNSCFLKNMHCYGVELDIHTGVCFKEILSNDDIDRVRNSKYVYSDTEKCYSKIKEQLADKKKVIFIGLPCQVAGLKSYLGITSIENLIVVDIVCHGTCPYEYLVQHIKHIEDKKNQKADTISFRNPDFDTAKYHFTIKNRSAVFYNKGVYEDDLYQIGYHKSLIYRESCYNCKYARAERVGDLTIADFSGLGKVTDWEKRWDSVSMIIVSTDKGNQLLEKLTTEDRIYIERRPSEEAFLYEHQLEAPPVPHPNRSLFLSEYEKSHNFEKAAGVALKKEVRKNMTKKYLHINEIKNGIRMLIPSDLKKIIKRILD